jgi:hypothetical protein
MSINLNLFIFASLSWGIKESGKAEEPDAESILQSHFDFARVFWAEDQGEKRNACSLLLPPHVGDIASGNKEVHEKRRSL